MKTILIIEDSAFEQEEFREVLTGYEVMQAYTAAEGRRYFESRKNDIDAIIFDGYLGSNDPARNTLRMISDCRKEGFAGPMFAASNDPAMRTRQMTAGCQYTLRKLNKQYVPKLIEQALAEFADLRRSGT